MLRGVLEDGEEIGLELVPGYRLRVLKLKCLCMHSLVDPCCISSGCEFLVGVGDGCLFNPKLSRVQLQVETDLIGRRDHIKRSVL